MTEPADILAFWLNEVGPERWQVRDSARDARIDENFGAACAAARKGDLDQWGCSAKPALALLILLDQLPRKIHRDSAETFTAGSKALKLAKRAIDAGWDLKVPEPERQFFYLPLMHSESLSDQERCIRLISGRMPQTGASNLPRACAHRNIIRRFGRFPHRNAALDRRSTKAEVKFLAEGGHTP